MVKVTVLVEDTGKEPGLCAEHGLSLYLETEKHKVLFDMGQSGTFAKNAEALDIDLKEADLAVISHGHYDHGGGLKAFCDINHKVPIYTSRFAFAACISEDHRNIGLDPSLIENQQMVLTEDKLCIDDELELCSCNHCPRLIPIDPAGLKTIRDGTQMPDDFRHEQYLIVHDGNKQVVVTGCSHKGILNIVHWLQPDILIGGFHLMNLPYSREGKERLENIAETLMKYDTIYYTGHCTGTEAYHILKQKMGDRIHSLSTGQRICL